jgi:hypothetical protein
LEMVEPHAHWSGWWAWWRPKVGIAGLGGPRVGRVVGVRRPSASSLVDRPGGSAARGGQFGSVGRAGEGGDTIPRGVSAGHEAWSPRGLIPSGHPGPAPPRRKPKSLPPLRREWRRGPGGGREQAAVSGQYRWRRPMWMKSKTPTEGAGPQAPNPDPEPKFLSRVQSPGHRISGSRPRPRARARRHPAKLVRQHASKLTSQSVHTRAGFLQ